MQCCTQRTKVPKVQKLPDMEVEDEELAGTPRNSHRMSMKRTETPSDLHGSKEKAPSHRRKPMKKDASKESKMASEQESQTVKTACEDAAPRITAALTSAPGLCPAHLASPSPPDGFANMVWIQNLKTGKKKDET